MIGWLAAGSAILTAWNAREEQKRENAVLDSRVAAIEEQRRYDKQSYELQTFARYWEAEEAGTMRLAMNAGLGVYSRASQGDLAQMRRDDFVGQRDQAQRDRQAELHTKELKEGKASPDREALASGLGTLTSFIPLFMRGGGSK